MIEVTVRVKDCLSFLIPKVGCASNFGWLQLQHFTVAVLPLGSKIADYCAFGCVPPRGLCCTTPLCHTLPGPWASATLQSVVPAMRKRRLSGAYVFPRTARADTVPPRTHANELVLTMSPAAGPAVACA